ncbi:MAG: phosphoglucosamine mutase [Planctomycetota bacterium]
MSEPIISVSGLRGIIGESLNPILAIQYSVAFANLITDSGPIVVTRDGRSTGPMLAQAICSGLSAAGKDVVYGDVAATPTTGILVKSLKASAGIQISASHNPAPYNGIKLFGSDGRVIPADAGEKVIAGYQNFQFPSIPHDRLGKYKTLPDTTTAHWESVLKTIDVNLIQSKNYKVVLDSHHGAGSVLGRKLLKSLNCDFEILGGEPDGLFTRSPEPTEQNLKQTTEAASRFGADAVFCQDPDADRLAIIDETGCYIGEEYTLAITLEHALKTRKGPVVINCSSSRMSSDICKKYGCDLHLSAVGEANVTNKMIELDAVYGGEGNGGPIDPRVGHVRDSFVAMAQILDAMAKSNKKVSELAAEIPAYKIHKTKIQVDRSKVPDLYEILGNQFRDAQKSTMDGLRLDWDDKWILVRPSNTEPIVRAIAEATTIEQAVALCDAAAKAVTELR